MAWSVHCLFRSPWMLLMLYSFVPCSICSSASTKELHFSVPENATVNSIIAHLRPHLPLPTTGPQPPESYMRQLSLSGNAYFALDTDANLIVKRPLNRQDDIGLCVAPGFPVTCVWSGVLVLPSSQHDPLGLRIRVLDLNDHAPRWSETPIILSISEGNKKGTLKELPLAEDRDTGVNGVVSYRLLQDRNMYFSIDIKMDTVGLPVPRLRLETELDREVSEWHNLTLLAWDGAEPFHTGSVPLFVRVLDENDNSPVFSQAQYNLTVQEDLTPATELTDLHIIAKDADEGLNGQLRYQFSMSTSKRVLDYWALDPVRAQLSLRRPLDAAQPIFTFSVMAVDHGEPARTGEAMVLLHVQDTNNHAPEVQLTPLHGSRQHQQPPTVHVIENTPPGQLLATLSVRDRDSGSSGQFYCKLATEKSLQLVLLPSGSLSSQLKIYKLLSKKIFDFEERSTERETLICEDLGEPKQVTRLTLQIQILNVNDNPPTFPQSRYQIEMDEDNTPNAIVGQIQAQDNDEVEGGPSNLTYSILWHPSQGENPFRIDNLGVIRAVRTLDRELNPRGFTFEVSVFDNGTPPLNSTAQVSVLLRDMNDCTPTFLHPNYTFTVDEDVGAHFVLNHVGQVLAEDCDLGMNQLVEYSLLPTGSPFHIDSEGRISSRRVIDREQRDHYRMQILANDKPADKSLRKTGKATLTIRVLDLNDHAPTFVTSTIPDEPIRVSYQEPHNYVIAQIRATDDDDGRNAEIVYSLTGGNVFGVFHIRELTGEVVVQEAMVALHQGLIELQVTATDQGLPQLSSSCTLKLLIDDSPPKGMAIMATTDAETSFPGNVLALAGVEGNQLIIGGIVLTTLTICCLLAVAICCMARRRGATSTFCGRLFSSSRHRTSLMGHSVTQDLYDPAMMVKSGRAEFSYQFPTQHCPVTGSHHGTLMSTSYQQCRHPFHFTSTCQLCDGETGYALELPGGDETGVLRPLMPSVMVFPESSESHAQSTTTATFLAAAESSDGDSGRGGSLLVQPPVMSVAKPVSSSAGGSPPIDCTSTTAPIHSGQHQQGPWHTEEHLHTLPRTFFPSGTDAQQRPQQSYPLLYPLPMGMCVPLDGMATTSLV